MSMKNLKQETRTRMLVNVLTACAVVLFAVVLYRINDIMTGFARLMDILSPLIISVLISLMMRPPMLVVEKLFSRLPGKPSRVKKQLYRALSLVIVYAALFTLVIGFFAVVVPQFVISAQSLTETVTRYVAAHRSDIEWFLREFNITDITGQSSQSVLLQWEDIVRTGMDYLGKGLMGLVNMSYSLWGLSMDLVMSVIISIYLLFGWDRFIAQGKKACCAFLRPRHVRALFFWLRRTHAIFTGFISGKLIDSVVVGVVCYMGMLIFKMDYALLISVIVAVTNVIPFFGAILGAVIGIVILLMINPVSAFWFAIFILVLQQLDGNVFGPRILGDSLGLSSFWVILAIILGGGLFGVMGMIMFIPVFAILYEIVSAVVHHRLQKRGYPQSTAAYEPPGLPPGVDDAATDGKDKKEEKT